MQLINRCLLVLGTYVLLCFDCVLSLCYIPLVQQSDKFAFVELFDINVAIVIN